MRLHLIVVGKLKSRELEAIEADYLKRMGPLSVQIHELKARAQNKSLEGDLILSKLQDLSKIPSEVYLLMERGREYTSEHFSDFVFAVLEQGKQLILIICGAEGRSDKLQAQVPRSISLSKLTFPHKIARIVLVEQIYRALTIKNKHPYHN